MTARSLTQVEAEERAALLEVQRYDIDVDLTGLPTGPEVRCTSRVTFTCKRPGATTFGDCSADVVSATAVGRSWADAMDDLDWHRQDVLIVGSSPTGAFSRIFLGSSAGKIVRHAPVPVIVVPWDPSDDNVSADALA